MEAPYVDPDIISRLQEVREELELRWARMPIPTALLDAQGRPVARMEFRWALWQRANNDAPEHLVMWLRDEDDGYRAPGEWLVQLMLRRKRMLEASSDDPMQLIEALEADLDMKEQVAEKDWDTYCTDVANSWADYLGRMSIQGSDIPGN